MTLVVIRNKEVVVREPKIPELDKLSGHHDKIVTIRNFLEWLLDEWVSEKESQLGAGGLPIRAIDRNTIIDEYLGLDNNKLEYERRMLLVFQRILNAKRDLLEDKEMASLPKDKRELLTHQRLREVENKEQKELGVRT